MINLDIYQFNNKSNKFCAFDSKLADSPPTFRTGNYKLWLPFFFGKSLYVVCLQLSKV